VREYLPSKSKILRGRNREDERERRREGGRKEDRQAG
jgi:hypothetical protein